MQTMPIASDVTSLNAEVYSAVQVMPENGKQSSCQFNKILKTVQEKPENAKLAGKKNEHVDEEKTQGTHTEGIPNAENKFADLKIESLPLQNSSDMLQQNQTQNLLPTVNIPWGLILSSNQSPDRPMQSITMQNTPINQPTSVDNLPFSSISKGSMLTNQSQVAAIAASSVNTHLPSVNTLLAETTVQAGNSQLISESFNGCVDSTNLFAANQQNMTQISLQATAIAVQEGVITPLAKGNEAPLPVGSMANQIKNISPPKNQTFQLTSASEGILIPEGASAEASFLDAKITFPISSRQTFQHTGNSLSDEALTDPGTLLLKDHGDSDIVSLRDPVGYHDILSLGKATATVPATEQTASDINPQNIVTQIVEQARLTTSAQNSEMVIKLKPEHLGELTLKVAVSNGVITATFHSNNSDVRNVLEASIVQFKQEMANAGIKVNYVGVYSGLNQFFSGGQRGNSGQHLQSSYRQKVDGEAIKEVEAWTASQVTDIQSTGVDYRI